MSFSIAFLASFSILAIKLSTLCLSMILPEFFARICKQQTRK